MTSPNPFQQVKGNLISREFSLYIKKSYCLGKKRNLDLKKTGAENKDCISSVAFLDAILIA